MPRSKDIISPHNRLSGLQEPRVTSSSFDKGPKNQSSILSSLKKTLGWFPFRDSFAGLFNRGTATSELAPELTEFESEPLFQPSSSKDKISFVRPPRSKRFRAHETDPAIYLFPAHTLRNVTVTLKLKLPPHSDLDGNEEEQKPTQSETWNLSRVFASGRMELVESNGSKKPARYLSWDSSDFTPHLKLDLTRSLCVPRGEACEALDRALEKMGLLDRHRDDFIAYWNKYLRKGPYTVLHFADSASYCQMAQLDINPHPKVLIRFFLMIASSEEPVDECIQEENAWLDTIAQHENQHHHHDDFFAMEWSGMYKPDYSDYSL